MKPVIYLTGAPAAGKSTLCQRLTLTVSDLTVLSYSQLLKEALLKQRPSLTNLSGEDLRRESSKLINPEVIQETDDAIIKSVTNIRKTRGVIIDSHPVTKEAYGFRITPFRLDNLLRLRPTHICMLYCLPEETQKRILVNPQGRPMPSEFEANLHISLQAQVANIYAINLALPVYLFDTTQGTEQTHDKIVSMLRKYK